MIKGKVVKRADVSMHFYECTVVELEAPIAVRGQRTIGDLFYEDVHDEIRILVFSKGKDGQNAVFPVCTTCKDRPAHVLSNHGIRVGAMGFSAAMVDIGIVLPNTPKLRAVT